MTTDTSTEAIAALMDGVTPGPWFPNSPPYHAGMIEVAGPSLTCRGFTIATDVDEEKAASIKSDARFIAAARELVPALSAERDTLRAEVERLRNEVQHAIDHADAAIEEVDRLRAIMSRAHAVMRECGWQLAIATEPQGDGILEAACTEIEAEFAEVLK